MTLDTFKDKEKKIEQCVILLSWIYLSFSPVFLLDV